MRLALLTVLGAALVASMPATAAAPGRIQVVALEYEYRMRLPPIALRIDSIATRYMSCR
jgi:hypothetical protein